MEQENELQDWFLKETQPQEQKIESGVERDEPEIDRAEAASIEEWQNKITHAKIHFKDDFQRMRDDMVIARQGAGDEWINNGNYTVPIVNQYINKSVAGLYAKNPTATAEKRKTLDYELWDGKPDSAKQALETMVRMQQQMAQTPQLAQQIMADPSYNEAQALVADIEQGRKKHEMMMRITDTMEILFEYYSNEQKPRLKMQMKSFVRRAKTCGVAYMMLGFQRDLGELDIDETVELADSRHKLAEMKRRMQDELDGEIVDGDPEMFELETLITDLENKEGILLREGPKFMFPRATEIIVDPRCTQLMGFIGAGWIAREFHKSSKEIQKIYDIDVSGGYTPYTEDSSKELAKYHQSNTTGNDKETKGLVCVWEVHNKELNQTFTICDGYNGYLKSPSEPEYWMEGFWPIHALTFNDVESESKLYPPSDVHMLKPIQAEYNRSRQFRREHREANKPKYVSVKGRMTEEDKTKLANSPSHALIELESMQLGESVDQLVQRFQPVPIDPALYETNSEMEDTLRIVGAQEANIGGTSGATATESSISESGRQTSVSSNVDDLDEFLSDMFGALGQLLIMELSVETVKEIAGIGAVWPEMDREQVAKEVALKIRAGSSGRPNKAAELANMERGMQYLLQLPGVNPYPLGQRFADLLEIELDDVIVEGMPSVQAVNAIMIQSQQAQQGAGTESDPAQQGAEGANNAQSTTDTQPGPQPSYQEQHELNNV